MDMVDLAYCLLEYERSGDSRFELTGEEIVETLRVGDPDRVYDTFDMMIDF